MNRKTVLLLTVLLSLLSSLVASTPGYSQAPIPLGMQRLEAAADGPVEFTLNPFTNTPSFIRSRMPLLAAGERASGKLNPVQAAYAFIERYADLFGVVDAARELAVAASTRDTLGMTHITLRQVHAGVDVYNGEITLHLAADNRTVLALSNAFVPEIQVTDVQPQVTAGEAAAAAQAALPGGQPLAAPRLVIYPGQRDAPGATARLAWLVELRDDTLPARNLYIVDATRLRILGVANRLYEAAGQPAPDAPVSEAAGLAKIAPAVLAATAAGGQAEFLAVMARQADLSGAAALPTKAEKGAYVYRTLYGLAESSQAGLRQWLTGQGIAYQSFYIVNAVLVQGDRDLALALARRTDVQRIDANPPVQQDVMPVEPVTPAVALTMGPAATTANENEAEPGIRYVRAPGVWFMGYTGAGVVVGGLDTGYDWDHPALKRQYRGWNGASANHDYNWHDSVHSGGGTCGKDAAAPCDDGSHGTHTMGTVLGADGDNRIGMAPGAKWIGCRGMDQGVGTPARYLECLEFFLAPYPVGGAPAQGRPDLAPDLTTNSWTCPPSEGCTWSTLQQAFEAQKAAGIMSVVAAGNSGAACSTVKDPPSVYEAGFTVGALKGGADEVATFSGRGPVTVDKSYRLKPNLVAPGTNVRSSVPNGKYEGGWQGTSMAAPHVAGAIALLWSAQPSLMNQIGQTEAMLSVSAIHITDTSCYSSVGWPNNTYGYGRLDALAAVRRALAQPAWHRYRETYDAQHATALPGHLVRAEGQPAINDADVDHAHDFAGATYDYYLNTHQRDSYDGNGATIVSTAHYSRDYQNAFWNGEQMVYGDNFPAKDVVAHELTHAVTERTAKLEYRYQSGALNESFSDIFAVMVDREDWLLGEDLPPEMLGGRDAIRDLADPARFGQPAHAKDWLSTCSDEEGVHTNSGITNKAYYNIATHAAVGKDKAERIFYRALTVYLKASASLEDARAAALQSAQDLYGSDTAVFNAVRDGFNAVGLDGQWNPPGNDCTCTAAVTLAEDRADGGGAQSAALSPLQVAITLYQVRDRMLSHDVGGRYYRSLYETHTARASQLFLVNPQLRAAGGGILAAFAPGLGRWVDGAGDQVVVTQGMIDELTAFLRQLAAEDRAHGGGALAAAIERETGRLNLSDLVGRTFDQAWAVVLKAEHARDMHQRSLLH